MATHTLNQILKDHIDALAAADIRCSWHMTNTSIITDNDGVVTNGDFGTPDEFDGAGYTAGGFTLTGVTATKDDATDRAFLDATNLAAGAQAAGTRDVAGLLIYRFQTNWASSTPIAWLEVGFQPNGGTITINWNALGIYQISG